MSSGSFLSKEEKRWFLTNAVCWPLIIVGLVLGLTCSSFIGVPLVIIPFGVIVWVMWDLMMNDGSKDNE